ncbi:DUF4132 domain-containing protein [Streptomyces longisporoflavus]|uniref:DUF4132 domain-containing protein n=1 Tax=Streptomyces longisporoflavus TaxID=28044 RepID=A0ABW7R4N1_9ACTN
MRRRRCPERTRSAPPPAARPATASKMSTASAATPNASKRTVNAERLRLTGMAAENRTWTYADWSRYYRDHPITGVITRLLEWEYATPDSQDFHPLDPCTPSAPIPGGARVRLRP